MMAGRDVRYRDWHDELPAGKRIRTAGHESSRTGAAVVATTTTTTKRRHLPDVFRLSATRLAGFSPCAEMADDRFACQSAVSPGASIELTRFQLETSASVWSGPLAVSPAYLRALESATLGDVRGRRGILGVRSGHPTGHPRLIDATRATCPSLTRPLHRPTPCLTGMAAAVLDAPGVLPHHRADHLAWGGSNLLGVILGDTAHLWRLDESAHNENRARLSGSLVGSLSGRVGARGPMTSVRFGPCGATISTAWRSGPMDLWDTPTGRRVGTIDLPRARAARSVAWRGHDGGGSPLLASCGQSRHVTLHDPRSMRGPVATMDHPGGVARCAAWSADGRLLATGGSCGILRIWDVRAVPAAPLAGSIPSESLRLPSAGDGAAVSSIEAVAWSPTGPRLVATGDACGVVRLWSAGAGAHVATKARWAHGTRCALRDLVWWADGRGVIAAHAHPDAEQSLLQLGLDESGGPIAGMRLTCTATTGRHQGTVLSLAAHPEGTVLASVGKDERLHLQLIAERPTRSDPEGDKPTHGPTWSFGGPGIIR